MGAGAGVGVGVGAGAFFGTVGGGSACKVSGWTAPARFCADAARSSSKIPGFAGSEIGVGLIPHRERPGEAIRAALQSFPLVGVHLSTATLLGAL